ncbi:Gfo/Idh/MocA family oxidoreductase [Pelagicoccus mobilis]|uniref:Gfo/Idh/MocA family oxidoreductase n=1 Tax=Pelagicoccus mobilis TaxID=415221 RepID=A0A934RXS2_9BACT|nr:Gfo/Idh/MocA family oxidoreductase [Pelagicoccus mobilis]MBK1877184.1 Gfo/Idh/MocA family oxidoreductase [Pelagicoccus mobilis]
MSMFNQMKRREFLKKGLFGLGAASVAPNLLLASKVKSASAPSLRFAVIGVGDITQVHFPWVKDGGHDVTILCDVDQRRLDPVNPMISIPERSFPKGYPNAKRMIDYREVFANHSDEFDAVLCGAVDHHHFGVAELALKHGKPIYCEKPLCWSTEEGFRLQELTLDGNVPTQLGNQGNSANGWRYADGYYRQGDLGDIVEVHGWIHYDNAKGSFGLYGFPPFSAQVPEFLDWERWLGPAGDYPFMEHGVHPGGWRWWVPFGGGLIGDWGCHVFGGIFKTLDYLGYPSKVEVIKATEIVDGRFPVGMTVKWHFDAVNGKPPVDMYFHTCVENDPAFYPPRPKELEDDRSWPPSKDGCYWVGTKGTFVMHEGHNMYGALIPELKRRSAGRPQLHFPLMKGNCGTLHGQEFVEAATGLREWDDTISNFDYGAKLSAIVQMGNGAMKAGHAVQIDTKTGWPVDPVDHQYFKRQNANKEWYSL